MAYKPPHLGQRANDMRTKFTRREISDKLYISNGCSGSLAVSLDDTSLAAIFVNRQHLYTSSPSQIFYKSKLASIENNDDHRREYPAFRTDDFGATFQFDEWVRTREIQFLEPHSEEVQRMLSIRWKGTSERTEEMWEDSFRRRWAVVTSEKMVGRNDNPMHQYGGRRI
ncbi:hypothetical protein C8R44DRAFT_726868 [Mycena epipterygia]|nr:hypothetical protein C8R44DRAFT_726868 [Mycena epipterygia]